MLPIGFLELDFLMWKDIYFSSNRAQVVCLCVGRVEGIFFFCEVRTLMLFSACFVHLFLMFKTNFFLNRQSSAGISLLTSVFGSVLKCLCAIFFKFTSLIFSPEGVHSFFKDISAYLLLEVFFNRAHTFCLQGLPWSAQ